MNIKSDLGITLVRSLSALIGSLTLDEIVTLRLRMAMVDSEAIIRLDKLRSELHHIAAPKSN